FIVVSAQSRTAVLALLFSTFVGVLLVAYRRRLQASYAAAIGLFLVASIASIAFVQTFPPDVGSFGARFAPEGVVDDSSVTIRFSRWRSIFAGFLKSSPSFCEGE